MTCPNCEMLVKYGTLCTHCGTDGVILEKTVKLSDKLYNKGLAEARSGNLSFAMESLQKSVSYNSNNTAARNLLGLVYFEFGRVADACRQWIISCTHINRENPAQKYLAVLEEDPNTFEQYAEAIQKYNNALPYIAQRNEDMAIIQLRRAIELNPGFIDALNLCALCHIVKREKQEAQVLVDTVLSIDVSNPIALNYYKILNPGRMRYSPTRRRAKDKKPTNYLYTKPKGFINVFHSGSIALFAAGIVLTSVFFLLAIMPHSAQEARNENAALAAQIAAYDEQKDAELAEKDEEIAALNADIERLTDERAHLSMDYLRQDRINKVHTAQALLSEGQIIEAAEYIFDLDADDLPRDVKDIYDDMAGRTVLPAAALMLYNGGQAAYNRSDYDEAARQLERALLYAQAGSALKSDVLFYLGLTAQAREDVAAAVSYYTDIIENYPNANPSVIENAQARLGTLVP